MRLLANRRTKAFADLRAALPDRLRRGIERLSPLGGATRLEAPVELVSAPRDKYFPVPESRALERAAPRVTVTVTRASATHAIPVPSLAHPVALLQFDAFAVRALKHAGG